MTDVAQAIPTASIDVPASREIGRLRSDTPGPTLIAVAAIHGNERAGIEAARRVLRTLARREGLIRGELVAFAGNLAAARVNQRYIARDLNRAWAEEHVDEVMRKAPADRDAEDKEQLELLSAVEEAKARARGTVHLIDMHTTSASGIPFVLFGDTLRQRRFVCELPLTIVMGLEEQVDGVLSAFFTRRGCVTCAVEGGQHTDPTSVDNLEAALLLAAESAGIFGSGLLAETAAAHALLERRRGHLPRVMEVISRHAITPEDKFEMVPGFANLDRAHADQLLARDRNGPIRAPRAGMVILPLYQGQGSDGFFWGREVSSARLRASEAIRHLELDKFLHLLPGVERDPTHPSRFFVHTRVARLYPLDVFHMFGYRRIREGDEVLTVERQPG
ncbi:MAG: succinylglutamate desuccinylase/aspartoacylase family protein [Myxococcales bacterium]|nr:succinylglutamate desuccinylase/aspartoacylase family protein [Myxococcales bacterium]